MIIPTYRDLLNRALTLPALEDDPEEDLVLFLQPVGHPEQGYNRAAVRGMLAELRDNWGSGTPRTQEQFAHYVANISGGRLAGD